MTSEAVRQSRQTIRKLRRENPDARIIVTGCAAQIDPAQYDKMAEVDYVVGNDDKMQAETWQGIGANELERVSVNDIFFDQGNRRAHDLRLWRPRPRLCADPERL